MKRISIYQDHVEPIHLYDNDDSNIDEYTSEVESLLVGRHIKKIETTSGVAFVRPSKVNSITVTEVNSIEEKPEQIIKAKKVKKIEEDIITDAD